MMDKDALNSLNFLIQETPIVDETLDMNQASFTYFVDGSLKGWVLEL